MDLTGKRFGKFVVVGVLEHTKSGVLWLCLCDCGSHTARLTGRITRSSNLGCRSCWLADLRRKGLTHGDARGKNNGGKTRLYELWKGMWARCENPKHVSFKYYGGKGVRVCLIWADFSAFREWALSNGYKPGLSIDRKNPAGNYEPDNCHWVTRSENSRRVKLKVV